MAPPSFSNSAAGSCAWLSIAGKQAHLGDDIAVANAAGLYANPHPPRTGCGELPLDQLKISARGGNFDATTKCPEMHHDGQSARRAIQVVATAESHPFIGSSVDQNRLPGDVGSALGGQPHNGVGDLFWFP